MSDRTPVLFDTDIGSDIDDAVALAYLLCQPQCELVGITTVTGETSQRAALAQVICEAAERPDIPIHCGAGPAIPPGSGQERVHQYPAIKDMPHRKDWPQNTAIDFLRQSIRERPGELTVLTVGPMTNIALLFAIDPEIPSMLKQIVSMAGCFLMEDRDQEYNIVLDPAAASMVYTARQTRHINFGLDVTKQCTMPADAVRERFSKPPLDAVLNLAELWFTLDNKDITFHDPLAAASIFHPEICEYQHGTVSLPWNDASKLGRSIFTPGHEDQSPHIVASNVNVPMFFERYFEVFDAT